MRTTRISAILLGLSLIVFFATTSARISGQGGAAPAIDNDDIGGVGTGAQGPGAGGWGRGASRRGRGGGPGRQGAGGWRLGDRGDSQHADASGQERRPDDRGRFVVPDLP